MPTGYTAGILDGTITDFKGFAKTCMRAFGATIHMRDEGLDKEYEPRVPSTYNLERMEELEMTIALAEEKSIEKFIEEERELIREEILSIKEQIEKKKVAKQKLDAILQEVQNWNPPTEEHVNFKEFMIEQLESTIRFDGDVPYYEKKREEVESRVYEILDGEKIKKRVVDSLRDSLQYQKKSHKEELDRCEKANKWVDELIQSI
jgi:hypothetical protein